MNMSSIPMKYQSFPLNIQLLLEIKCPLAFDIYDEQRDVYMLQDDNDSLNTEAFKQYLGKEHEVHSVLFEGNLGSFDNKIPSLLAMKKNIFKTMGSLHRGQAFDAQEWKITDIDKSLYNWMYE